MTNPAPSAGFTLIEVIVALAVLAIALGPAFTALSGGISDLERTTKARDAAMVGESALARVGHDIPVKIAHLHGNQAGYLWAIDVGPALKEPPPAEAWAAYPVRVSVSWADDRGSQNLRLDSVRLAPNQVDRETP